MSVGCWHERLDRYLAQRRALGYLLARESHQLRSLADLLEEHAANASFTTALALRWARQAPSGSDMAQSRRLQLARGFARFLLVDDPGTEVPPQRLLGPTHRRVPPRIFTESEVRALMEAADQLHPAGSARGLSMRVLIGLLVATGLRPGEGVRLGNEDVDTARGLIVVRSGKFGHERVVPLHESTVAALISYQAVCAGLTIGSERGAFFRRGNGESLEIIHADYAFRCLCRTLGFSGAPAGHRWPRLYDLRHTFVCRRLLAWHEAGESVDIKMPYLAAYLGHQKISSTYWYLSAIPELMNVVSERFAAFAARAEKTL